MMRGTTHEPARAPVRKPVRQPVASLGPPQQPTLPFEQSAPAMGGDEPTGVEMEPSEVWEALPRAMKMEVHRDCLRAMREVIGDGSQ